jgi:hypothetical protein
MQEVAPPDDDEMYMGTPPTEEATCPDSTIDRPLIANNRCEFFRSDDGDKPAYYVESMPTIFARVHDITHGWPKRIGKLLFFDRHGEVQFLEKSSDLFGWLHEYGTVSWRTNMSKDNMSFPTKEEFMSYVTSHVEAYEDIATYPHEPRMANFYYAWTPQTDYLPTGAYFDHLCALFANVETPQDAAMIRAMFMTPAWGGALGQRPAFAIQAPDRGCGKSTLADAVGQLYGGLIDLSINKHAEEEILQRLLTPSTRLQRVVRFDNVKGEINSALLEGLITATHVSGKQMYHGDARRPNTLVFILTGNGLRLSRDMAERCFIIRLVKPEYNPSWQEIVREFIEQHQQRILMDVLFYLQAAPRPSAAKDRWMPFVSNVLARCTDDADAVVAINQERRGKADTDIEEAELLFEAISNLPGEYHSNGWRFVANNQVVEACNDALNTKMPTRTILAVLRQHAAAGRFENKFLPDQKIHGGRRGVLYWKPSDELTFGG